VFHPDGVRAVLVGSRDGYSKRNRFYEQIAKRSAGGWSRATSTALTFTLHLLGRHSAEQQLIYDEIDAVLERRPPTVDDRPRWSAQ
jgi:hypothetical protein